LPSSNYYYFVASLPHLNYGDVPPFSSREFREQCNVFLNKDDAELIKYCCFDPKLAVETVKPTGSSFIDFIMLRERVLNLSLAQLRAARLKRQGPEEVPSDMPRAEAMAKSVFELDDPLEAELSMDRARWGILDELVGVNVFGANTIFAYLLKLQLMERKQRFNAEKGQAEYKNIYDTILNEYNSKVKEDA